VTSLYYPVPFWRGRSAAASLAVLLAIAGIASHRTHTAAIIRLKYHNLELGQSLAAVC